MFHFINSSIVRVFNAVVLVGIVVGLGIFTVLIGMYNYERSISDISSKASSIADVASVSLAEPLWNYDSAGLDGILTAIMQDSDVAAIRVLKPGSDKPAAERLRESLGGATFEELLQNPAFIENGAKILREGEVIANVQILTSTAKVRALIRYTTLLISGFALVFVFIIAAFIVFLGKRVIQRPIDALRASADQLASGHLDYSIDTSRVDELGSLAISFDRMRNAIRRKLADLALLNSTGEVMAGIHDQTEALKTTIRVMHEQTHVERGSIYLLDSESNLSLSAYYPEIEGATHQFPKSFKLSEGIAGHVATTGKTLFIPDVTKAPDYVSTGGNEKPKALLCVPMMDDKTVFGVMNFVGEVGKVEFDKEDEGFALTIARMSVITIKNIQMLEVIEEQNRTLEERILQRTAELRQKTNDVNNMLQNMRQGIFTITKNSLIHSEYSAFLTEIYETTDVANRKVSPFLFDSSSVVGDVLNQVEATIDALIGEEAMNFQFNSHLLVTEYTKQFDNGRTKILELDWNPVMNSDDIIDKLMVTVRDVTELKALQLETEKQKEQLEVIGQILAISKDKLLEFISSSYEFMDENKALIEKTPHKDLDVVAALFRNMHTVKGNARTYGLSYVTDSVHEAESAYSLLRTREEYPWDQQALLEQLALARSRVEHYERTFREKLAGISGEGIDASIIERISEAIDGIDELSQINDLKNSIRQIRNTINTTRYETVTDMLKGIVAALPSISKQLEKEVPDVEIVDNGVLLKKDIVPMLRNVFMHVVRNTMDHGLEATAERLGQGKPAQGRIALNVDANDEQVTFTVADDGRGLALARIYQKALTNGQLLQGKEVTDEEISEMIFLSGLSTATEVTNVSGRGVGMDAVRQFLNKYLGDVHIEFTGPRSDNGFRPFKLLITLPAKYSARQIL